MGDRDEMLELARKQSDALLGADLAAADEQAQRELDDTLDLQALADTQKAESKAQAEYNQAQYANLGQIVGDIQGKIDAAKAKDETALRREKAYRYISGLGDTISSLANLVGTAHGAANQQQTYNSHAVVQKAEEARKARKLEMDDLSKRLDEMTARQRELKASGSLAEAQLKAKQDREMFQLQAQQRAKADEAKRYADAQAHTAMREARADWQSDRAFNAQQKQWQKTYEMQLAKFNEEMKGNKYNFTLANESFDIPKDKLNDVNVERIYQMLPEEIRANIKGEQYTEIVPNEDPMMEPTKRTSYKAPSIAQKIAAIGAYADSDPAVKSELLRLAGKHPEPEAKPKEAGTADASSGSKWGEFKVDNGPSAAQDGEFYMNDAQKERALRKEKRRENIKEYKKVQLGNLYTNIK